MRRTRGEGRIKTKVRALLLAQGWDVLTFWEQHGDYRIHKYQWDVACWGCDARPTDGRVERESASNLAVQMACWVTMGACCKGLRVDFMGRDGWEINPL